MLRLDQLKHLLVGSAPRQLLLLAPTALALIVDLTTRGRSIGEVITAPSYAASVFLSVGLWVGPLWLASLLVRSRGLVARSGLLVLYLGWLTPLSIFAFAGQALHHRIFHAYMARDTVRFGLTHRAIVGTWFSQVGGLGIFIVLGGIGAALAFGFVLLARRASPGVSSAKPVLPAIAFVGALTVLFRDGLETRGLQTALPDICFLHGVAHAVRERVVGEKGAKREISMRTPAPLPPLPRPARQPNVLLIVTESVRADALCSEARPGCVARFLDEVAADRVGLGNLTAQSPGTISSCTSLWTGLGPEADYTTVHAAPTLWELARAVGYRTAYISAQNIKNADFGIFLARAGVDLRVSGSELGGVESDLVGAEDERATERTLAFIRDVPVGTPWYAVTHLSNTHSPYRTVVELEPYQPQAMLPIGGTRAVHNRYRNAVLLQERTLTTLLRELRKRSDWEDTAVVFVSDHGEQFGEHGGLYHLHTLFEEEIRVPGFIVAGARVLDDERRASLRSFAGHRTWLVDVTATIVDLFGLADARASLPFADRTHGRSLLRRRPDREPALYLSISSAVWEADGQCRGLIQGDRVLVETTGNRRSCYDLTTDPGEQHPLPAAACGELDGALGNAPW